MFNECDFAQRLVARMLFTYLNLFAENSKLEMSHKIQSSLYIVCNKENSDAPSLEYSCTYYVNLFVIFSVFYFGVNLLLELVIHACDYSQVEIKVDHRRLTVRNV